MTDERDPDAPTDPAAYLADTPEAAAKWNTALQPLSPPHDGLLLPLIHDLTKPHIDRGRAHGPIPPLRTDQWLDAHPDQQLAHLLLCGISVAISPPHATVAALLKSASRDIADGYEAVPPLPADERLRQATARADAWRRHADTEHRARLAAEARLRALQHQPHRAAS